MVNLGDTNIFIRTTYIQYSPYLFTYKYIYIHTNYIYIYIPIKHFPSFPHIFPLKSHGFFQGSAWRGASRPPADRHRPPRWPAWAPSATPHGGAPGICGRFY